MGFLAGASPALAAKALPRVAKALRDTLWDFPSMEVTELLASSFPALAAEALTHVIEALNHANDHNRAGLIAKIELLAGTSPALAAETMPHVLKFLGDKNKLVR